MLTKKQVQVLDFIKLYRKKNNYAPTLLEIKKNFKMSKEDETREFIKALKKADPEVIIIVFIDEYKPEVEDLFGLGI